MEHLPEIWIKIILLGGLMGMVGQGARVIVGFKKNQEQIDASFNAISLIIGLIIGFVAGAIAGLTLIEPGKGTSTETLLGIAAAGYAGTDFIENFITRKLGNAPPALANPNPTPPQLTLNSGHSADSQPPAHG